MLEKLARVLFLVICVLSLLGCGGQTTVYTGPAVEIGKLNISATVNSNGEIQLSADYPLVSFGIADIGSVSWNVGIQTTWNQAAGKSNTLFILYEDNGSILQQEYDIGQPFRIDFADDQWVRYMENDGSGNIVVAVERQAAEAPQVESNPQGETSSLSNTYWCDDLNLVKLAVGDDARVVWPKINLRSTPEVPQDFYENIVDELEEGTSLTVIGGPECAHNGTWWEIRTNNGQTGWSREHISAGYLLAP